MDTSTRGTQWGTGGMATKLTAARIATAAGCSTVICQASEPERMAAVMAGQRVGTVFLPHPEPIRCTAALRNSRLLGAALCTQSFLYAERHPSPHALSTRAHESCHS